MKHIEDLTKEDLGFFHVCLSCLHIQSPQWSEYIDRQYNDCLLYTSDAADDA